MSGALLENLIGLFIIGLVFYFLIKYAKNKKLKEQKSGELDTTNAISGYEPLNNNQGSSSFVEGETVYEGSENKINWKLTSTIKHIRQGIDYQSTVLKTKSVWFSSDVKFPQNKFLMIMSTPGEIKTTEVKKDGLLNKLANIAANTALDFYISGYFGNKYKQLINIGGDEFIIKNENAKDLFILTNYKNLTDTYLDDSTLDFILNWKNQLNNFRQEENIDNFGILFCEDGLFVSCQGAMANKDEAKILSDFAVTIGLLMIDKIILSGTNKS
jgi:hypothetical protein